MIQYLTGSDDLHHNYEKTTAIDFRDNEVFKPTLVLSISFNAWRKVIV